MSPSTKRKRKIARTETSSGLDLHGIHFDAPQSQTLSMSGQEQNHSSDWLDGSAFEFLERTDYTFGQAQFVPSDPWGDPSSLDLTYSFPSALQTPREPLVMASPARSQSTVPDERYTKVARLWPIRTQASRLSRPLWRDVARHGANGNVPDHVQSSNLPVADDSISQAYPEYSFDEASYQRLVREFGPLVAMPPTEATRGSNAYRDRRSPVGSRSETCTSQSEPTGIKFPSREVLDVSVGLFFRRFNPLFPFMHEPTFRARETPTSLLFSLCLIGLCYLGDEGAKLFVRTVAPVGTYHAHEQSTHSFRALWPNASPK